MSREFAFHIFLTYKNRNHQDYLNVKIIIVCLAVSLEEMLDVLPTDGVASVAQYLLCTQASNQSSSHRIQGLTVLSTQSLAMAVLPSGRCALLPLPLALLQLDSSSPLVHLDKKMPSKVASLPTLNC